MTRCAPPGVSSLPRVGEPPDARRVMSTFSQAQAEPGWQPRTRRDRTWSPSGPDRQTDRCARTRDSGDRPDPVVDTRQQPRHPVRSFARRSSRPGRIRQRALEILATTEFYLVLLTMCPI